MGFRGRSFEWKGWFFTPMTRKGKLRDEGAKVKKMNYQCYRTKIAYMGFRGRSFAWNG